MRRLGVGFLAVFSLAVAGLAQQAAGPVSPKPVEEKKLSGSLDVGYRWNSDVGGDFNTYRSVVNLGEGPKLLDLGLHFENPGGKYLDELTVSAANWGGDPYNSARIDAEKSGAYRFLFDYRNISYFNFLPSFADPRIFPGVLLDQRSFDIQRRYLNTELELRPGKRILPFLAYSRDWSKGTGITPFVTNGNEFPVSTNLQDKTDHYRGGVRFELKRWHLTLEQGGTTFKDDQHIFTNERNTGNRTRPLLGQDLVLDTLSQAYRIRATSTFNRILFTAAPLGWINVYGSFLYSRPNSDVTLATNSSGLFYLGGTRFFNTGQGLLSGEAKQPHTAGSASVELRPTRKLRILESWSTNRLHDASSAQLDQAIISAFTQTDGLSFSTDRLVMNYSRQQVDVFYDVTTKFTLRGGHRYEWGDSHFRAASLNPAGLPENGQLKRHVGLFGANYRPIRRLAVNVDFEGSSGDRTYFRTSLQNFQRVRGRVRFQALPSLQLSSDVLWMHNANPTQGVNSDFRNVVANLSLRWSPNEGHRVSLLGSYTWSSLRSDLLFLDPGLLRPAESFFRDNAHTGTALVDVNLPSFSQTIIPRISVGGSFFVSSGSRPSRYYQPLGRFLIPLQRHVSWYAEWRWYGLSQPFYRFEAFRTHQFLTGLRFTL